MLQRGPRSWEVGLAGYLRAVSAAVGVLPGGVGRDFDPPAAYLALSRRCARHPEHGLLLVWSAESGWELELDWMAARTKSDGAKLTLIFWCLLAFIGSGFEHVVANMTVFSLGMFENVPGATFGSFAANLVLVGLGNFVGGGVLVGASYGFLGRSAPESEPRPAGEALEPASA